MEQDALRLWPWSPYQRKNQKNNEILHEYELNKAKSEVCRRLRYYPKDEH